MNPIDIVMRAIGVQQAQAAVKEVSGTVRSLGEEAEKTGEKLVRLNKNGREIDAKVRFVKVTKDVKGLGDELDKTGDKALGAKDRLESLSASGARLSIAGAGGIMLSRHLQEVARGGEAATAKMEAMLKKRGELDQLGPMNDWAGDLALDAALPDDDILKESAAGLLGFGLNAKQVRDIMPGLIGQSRLYNQSIDSVTMSFGKAFASRSAGALTKSGVTLDPADLEKLKSI